MAWEKTLPEKVGVAGGEGKEASIKGKDGGSRLEVGAPVYVCIEKN